MPTTVQHMLGLVKPGDQVLRMLAGSIPMPLKVTEVTETEILCGKRDIGWMFDRKTGAEIDEDLGWGPPPKMTGSYILPPVPPLEVKTDDYVPETKDEHVQSAAQ